MKDFLFWREAISNSRIPLDLKSVGEDLAQFQSQTGLFIDDEKKLTDDQVVALRNIYSERMKKLQIEQI